MNCVKIVADDKKSSIAVRGTPLDCFCIVRSVTVKTLANIIPSMFCRPEAAIDAFGITVTEQLRKRLGVDSDKEKPQEEECREHVCRCRKASEEERNPTLEELAEMIGKLDAGKLQRLSALIMKNAVDSLTTD